MTTRAQTFDQIVSVLFRPSLIQQIIADNPYRTTNLIAIFSCTAFAAIVSAVLIPTPAGVEPIQAFVLPLIIGVVFGIPILNAVAWVLDNGVTHLGGEVSIEEARSMIAWAALPTALFNIPWYLYQAGVYFLLIDRLPNDTLIFTALWFVAALWGLIILHPVLSGIAHLSLVRTILAIAGVYGVLFVVAGGSFGVITLGLQALHLTSFEITPHLEVSFLAGGAVLMIVIGLQRQNRSEVSHAEQLLAEWRSEDLPDVEVMEMARPAAERLWQPLWQRIQAYGTRITPADQIREMQKLLVRAGRPYGMGVTEFFGMRLLVSASLGLLVFGITALLPSTPKINQVLLTIVGFSLGIYIPTYWLKGQIAKRQKEIQRALPDALDMLTICVEAGLGFDGALQRVASNFENALGEEFSYVLHEMRIGVRRSEALRHLANRTDVPDLASLIAILVQADRLGVPLSHVLKSQSQQMRMRRRQRAEEEAHKAPVKMLLPLSMFVLPATMMVVLGPAIPRFVLMMSKF